MKRNKLKEMWINRPTRLLPDVFRMMKRHPYKSGKNTNFKLWIRNIFYLNWQVCYRKRN